MTTLSTDLLCEPNLDNELNRRGYTLGNNGELITGDGYELEPWEVSDLEDDICSFYGG